MEATRTALESEHKLQLLQMQAINALWKKVVSLQPGNRENNLISDNVDGALQPNADVVSNLAQTCNLLHTQVSLFCEKFNWNSIRNCISEVSNLFISSLGSTATRFNVRDQTLYVQYETTIFSC